MRSLNCCIPGCASQGMTHHRFPNPRTYLDNFHRWIDILNMELFKEMDPFKVYTNYRVCFAHFEPRFKSPGCPRLHRNAYPSLNLPDNHKPYIPPATSVSSAATINSVNSKAQIQFTTNTKSLRCIDRECITNTLSKFERNEEGRMFSLPANKELRNKWLKKLNRPDLKNLTHSELYNRDFRLCHRHFSDKQLQNYLKIKLKTKQVPLAVDPLQTPVKRSAPETVEEIPLKKIKVEVEEPDTNEQPEDTVIIEEDLDEQDEEKIAETIRRLELVRQQRTQNTGSTKKSTMTEEMGAVLHKAVVLDVKKCYNESLVYYQKGIELLCIALKSETNEQKKEYLKNKVKEYLGRAEKIKDLLKRQAKYHEQITIENNSTGHSYEKLFKKYLDVEVETVKIEDPYIRLHHQCQNFLMFCELLVKSCVNLTKIYLITSLSLNHSECVDQQKWLNEIKESLLTYKIELDITYSSTLHDRQISLSNGWIIKIGRGLDYFKKSAGKFCIGNNDYDLRLCNETTIDIFHQENIKQSFG